MPVYNFAFCATSHSNLDPTPMMADTSGLGASKFAAIAFKGTGTASCQSNIRA